LRTQAYHHRFPALPFAIGTIQDCTYFEKSESFKIYKRDLLRKMRRRANLAQIEERVHLYDQFFKEWGYPCPLPGHFKRAVDLTILAQEILVSNSRYPTEAIARNSEAYRPLGLGYANLGAFLMATGLPVLAFHNEKYSLISDAEPLPAGYPHVAKSGKEVEEIAGNLIREPPSREMGGGIGRVEVE
jgi:hypothetical protein